MWLFVVAVVAGLAGLVWGADRFVAGSAAGARKLGVSPMVVGLTVVGCGTSAPEILVSAMAAWQGNPGVAVGNAIGSNIANVGLVIGATAAITPVAVASGTLRRELPALFVVFLLAWLLLQDGELGRADGAALLGGGVMLVAGMALLGRRVAGGDPLQAEFSDSIPTGVTTARLLFWMGAGLVALLVGSRAVVWGAVGIAQSLGVSDLVVGLTVVAVGTSLPELAASLASVLKREPDIAVGNIIGSNMFNLLPVLALPGLLAPGPLPPEVLWRDYPWMVGLSAALCLMALGLGGPGRINRWEGLGLLAAFCLYHALLQGG